MKKSEYAIIVPSTRKKGEICLYHTLSDHLVRISESGDESLEELLKKIENGDEESLSEHEREVCDVLFQMGYLVPNDVDEYKLFEEWYRTVLASSYRSYVATILTTMACNLRCPYCYEQGLLSSSKFMSLEMAAKVSTWLKRQVRDRQVERVSLVYFGGEPLLNCQAIESIGGSIYDWCRSEGLALRAGVITNGTLLTGEVAELLASVGVSWAKVTLDGDREDHDRLRPCANGEGSFDRIFNNLGEAAKHLRLVIGGNVDESNIDSVPRLLDRLASAPWRDAIISVRLKPIQWNTNGSPVNAKVACQLSAFSEEQVEWMVRLREQVMARGLPVSSDPNVGPCDFYRPNVVSIGVDGSLYPCGAFVGMDEFSMGNVASDELTDFGREVDNIRAWDEHCYNCPFLPVCAGGCRAAAYFQKKDIGMRVCDLEFYGRIIPRYVADCGEDRQAEWERETMFG
jgi:uncharacterized protein